MNSAFDAMWPLFEARASFILLLAMSKTVNDEIKSMKLSKCYLTFYRMSL